MGPKMEAMKQRLIDARATASAGGEMVVVEVNGLSEVLRITIDPQLMATGDAEMIQDLTVAAVNAAWAKAKQLHLEEMKKLTEGVEMPGMKDILARMTEP
jgi:DNA-binding YbaB/EbfC family protein